MEANFQEQTQETLDYLASPAAVESLDADPYWPKWDSPWWRMALLHEMGLTAEIPGRVVETLVRLLSTRYLTTFPFRIEDVPAGFDPVRQIPCHCMLGTIYQVLAARGVDVDAKIPWIRTWFLRYALPDGGLNCDEAVYTRPTPHSSVVSTLPVLEAMLLHARRPFTKDEAQFLDNGAQYLIRRKLWRSVSRGGAVMDEEWVKPCFPRFYDYDLLRGLAWLVRWAEVRGKTVPRDAVQEAITVLEQQQTSDGRLAPGRQAFQGNKTFRRAADGEWLKGEPAASFPLLDAVSAVGAPSPWLSRQWASVRQRLAATVR